MADTLVCAQFHLHSWAQHNITHHNTIYCVTQTSAFHFSKVLFDVLVWRIGFSLHTCLHNSPKTYNVKKKPFKYHRWFGKSRFNNPILSMNCFDLSETGQSKEFISNIKLDNSSWFFAMNFLTIRCNNLKFYFHELKISRKKKLKIILLGIKIDNMQNSG